MNINIKNTIGKYIIMFFITIALSNPTFAQNTLCESQESMAEAIMQARQGGSSMSTTIGILKKHKVDTPANMALVRMAYAENKYSTKEFQQEAIDSFRNKVYLLCKRYTGK
jgi:hypothetical protein